MLGPVIRYLACPYCGDAMVRDGSSLRCAAGHTFDIARQGYVSLLPAGASGSGGDTAAMVQARAGFLAAGHFASVAAGVAETARDAAGAADGPGCVADIGAGTGYYLAAVLGQLPNMTARLWTSRSSPCARPPVPIRESGPSAATHGAGCR